MAEEIQRGDRFEDLDPRQGDRVIRIVSTTPINVQGHPRWAYDVEVAVLNPKTVGRRFYASEATLRERYKKVSR